MGIVNVTPDSFSDGGQHLAHDAAIAHGLRLHAEGALLVDVGGESTRPGADPVPVEQEWQRVGPVITSLAEAGVAVSVDTRHVAVAQRAIDAGAVVVNDVTGLRDLAMVELCAATGTPAVIMHMLGEPRTMQDDPRYADVVADVSRFLRERAEDALAAGVPSVLVDPGIGFGKRLAHNLALLSAIAALGPYPVLVGASRKRFLGELTGQDDPAARDIASVAAHLHVARQGAAMVRVHDVAAHVAALRVQHALDT